MPMMEPILSLHRRLEATAGAVCSLVTGIELGDARWKPAPDRWSILEVVNHLADEEVEISELVWTSSCIGPRTRSRRSTRPDG